MDGSNWALPSILFLRFDYIKGYRRHSVYHSAFALDIYGHVTDQMKQARVSRMESYITLM